MDKDASVPDQATRASHGALAGLHHSAGILRAVIARCEGENSSRDLDGAIAAGLELPNGPASGWCNKENGDYWTTEQCAKPYTSSLDAALSLLPENSDWRRLTDKGMGVYAASPYGGDTQKRMDGWGATPPLQLCSAALKLRLAKIEKAIATEARRAATAKQGAVHEGAGPQDIAQTPSSESSYD